MATEWQCKNALQLGHLSLRSQEIFFFSTALPTLKAKVILEEILQNNTLSLWVGVRGGQGGGSAPLAAGFSLPPKARLLSRLLYPVTRTGQTGH